ncbi:Regulatory protein RecX [compost metagenome]
MVEKQKKNKRRYNIFINDEYAFSVHEDIIVKHRLLKGENVDAQQIAQILQDEERHGAYLKAIVMLGRRPHSSKEVKRKLQQKGYEEDIVGWAVATLEQQNYINDEEFAKLWAEQRVVLQKKGRNIIKQELQQRGLSRDHIHEAIGTINAEEEFQGALHLAEKKWKQTKGIMIERKRKTASFLLRRGFTNTVVNKVLQQVSQSANEDEFEEVFDIDAID